MAKLPDVQSMGQRPLPQPVAPVQGPDTRIQSKAQVQLGETIIGMGDKFAEIGKRIQSRQDAIDRARSLNKYEEEAENELLRTSTENDLGLTQTVGKYGEFLKSKQNEILDNHAGTEDSRSLLAQNLEASRSKASFKAAALSHVAQLEQIEKTYGNYLTKGIDAVSNNPGSLVEEIQKIDKAVLDLSPALQPGQEDKLKQGARAHLVNSAAETLILTGQFDDARNVLSMPGAQESLGAEGLRKINRNILTAQMAQRNAQMQAMGETLGKLSALRKILGREPTPTERMDFLFPSRGKGEDSLFGKGAEGWEKTYMTKYVHSYKYGLTTPEQDRIFQNSAIFYSQQKQMLNPDTGIIETVNPVLPPDVLDALNTRGFQIPIMETPEPGVAKSPKGSTTITDGGAITPAKPEPGTKPSAEKPGIGQGVTAFSLADQIAGPLPAIGEGLSRTPLVGSVFPFHKITQAKAFIPQIQRELVTALQNSPRYAEGERQAIEKAIEIDSKIFDNPLHYINALIGIDRALEIRQRNAFNTAQSKFVPVETRRQAMNILNAITNFRVSLGVPPTITNNEERDALNIGDKYVDPEGHVRTRR